MKSFRVLGLCLLAVLGISAVMAGMASAHRVWTVKGKVLEVGKKEPITAKLQPGTKAKLVSVLTIAEKEETIEVECEALKIKEGNIHNVKGPTGQDQGIVEFEKCKLVGKVSEVCKLTAASAALIRVPPAAATGESLLVENKAKTEIWDDFLPEKTEEELEGKKVKVGLFAIIKTEGILCPIKEDRVVTYLPVGLPGEANEGEGGVVGKIKEKSSTVQDQVFPAVAGCPLEAINWQGNTIKVNEIFDQFKIKEKKCAEFKAEVEFELVSKEPFGVQ